MAVPVAGLLRGPSMQVLDLGRTVLCTVLYHRAVERAQRAQSLIVAVLCSVLLLIYSTEYLADIAAGQP